MRKLNVQYLFTNNRNALFPLQTSLSENQFDHRAELYSTFSPFFSSPFRQLHVCAVLLNCWCHRRLLYFDQGHRTHFRLLYLIAITESLITFRHYELVSLNQANDGAVAGEVAVPRSFHILSQIFVYFSICQEIFCEPWPGVNLLTFARIARWPVRVCVWVSGIRLCVCVTLYACTQ